MVAMLALGSFDPRRRIHVQWSAGADLKARSDDYVLHPVHTGPTPARRVRAIRIALAAHYRALRRRPARLLPSQGRREQLRAGADRLPLARRVRVLPAAARRRRA